MKNEIQLADSISIIQLTFIDPIPLLVFLLHEYFSFSFYWPSAQQRHFAKFNVFEHCYIWAAERYIEPENSWFV